MNLPVFKDLASHGAAIGIIIGMYLYRKNINTNHYLWVLDRVVISVASGAVFIRIGNFINSEIIGKVTDSNLWGFVLFKMNIIKDKLHNLLGLKMFKKPIMR